MKHFCMHSGNTLEVDVSDVMALDQLTSLFSPRKAIKKSYPNFFEKNSVCHIHTCHELEFDLGRSSTRYPSGLHKKSIHGTGPIQVGQLMFSREN